MKTLDLNELLQNHPYPGRGIVLGRSADDKKAVIAYFIMGRSENSRNRVFETTEDGIRTRAYDESKMVDPSLIIYHPGQQKRKGLGGTQGGGLEGNGGPLLLKLDDRVGQCHENTPFDRGMQLTGAC